MNISEMNDYNYKWNNTRGNANVTPSSKSNRWWTAKKSTEKKVRLTKIEEKMTELISYVLVNSYRVLKKSLTKKKIVYLDYDFIKWTRFSRFIHRYVRVSLEFLQYTTVCSSLIKDCHSLVNKRAKSSFMITNGKQMFWEIDSLVRVLSLDWVSKLSNQKMLS
jgi:hypothetical protein